MEIQKLFQVLVVGGAMISGGRLLANPNASFSVTVTQSISSGFFTATATDPSGNTSEISEGMAFAHLDIIPLGSDQVRLLWVTNLTGFVLHGVGFSIAGCAAGLALSAASSRVLTGMLFGVAPSDATTLSAVVLIVLTVAAIASLLPAIRAARVEPMQVLRDE